MLPTSVPHFSERPVYLGSERCWHTHSLKNENIPRQILVRVTAQSQAAVAPSPSPSSSTTTATAQVPSPTTTTTGTTTIDETDNAEEATDNQNKVREKKIINKRRLPGHCSKTPKKRKYWHGIDKYYSALIVTRYNSISHLVFDGITSLSFWWVALRESPRYSTFLSIVYRTSADIKSESFKKSLQDLKVPTWVWV